MNIRHPDSSRRRAGFSLPEVAIAIAVAGVSLMAVVGLLPGLLDADRGSGVNSVISSLATQALGELESQPYQAPPRTQVFLFSENGALVENPADARYSCSVTLSAIPAGGATAGGATSAPSPGPYCSLVTMEFTWPVGTTSKLNRRVIHATLAKN
ncbi:MAG TPA: prepilin-type N-terminal cleavage/methylation domain-containing protein [Candidatus Saccharimonadia bacterium]|nr:prepilin-type N-terminal cleavage/methylation domain-containing protein [Candidatus Saccharimonadia bacterium]